MCNQVFALLDAPFDTDGFRFIIRFAFTKFCCKRFGNVRTEYLRQHGELVLEYDRLDTRNDGDRNAFRPASVYECVIFSLSKNICVTK